MTIFFVSDQFFEMWFENFEITIRMNFKQVLRGTKEYTINVTINFNFLIVQLCGGSTKGRGKLESPFVKKKRSKIFF